MKRRVLQKTAPFHELFIKKARNGAVLNGTADYLFPLNVQRNRGRKLRSLVFLLPFFLLLVQKHADQGPLLAQNFPRVGGAATQWPPRPLSPLFLTIKIGEAQEKRGRKKRGIERRETREKKEEEKKKQKK
jgi:hypothetical protein